MPSASVIASAIAEADALGIPSARSLPRPRRAPTSARHRRHSRAQGR